MYADRSDLLGEWYAETNVKLYYCFSLPYFPIRKPDDINYGLNEMHFTEIAAELRQ